MTTKLKSWLVIALVFAAGFGAGVVVTRGVVRHFIQQAVANPDRVREVIERRLNRQLSLDDSQRQKVHHILVDSQKDLRELRTEFRPRFMEIVSNAEQNVSAVLTDEQQAKFEKFREENHRFWEPRAKP